MDTVVGWISELSKSLNSEVSLHLEVPTLVAPSYYPDTERQKTLATVSLEKLPSPMRTLLKALDELKCDMTRDKCDFLTSIEASKNAAIETSISFACNSLNGLIEEINEHYNADLESIHDPELKDAVEGIIKKSAPYKDWIQLLKEALVEERSRAFESIRSSSTVTAIVRPDRHVNIENVRTAIESSAQVRNRLRDLNSGNLTSLSVVKESKTTTVAEDLVLSAPDFETKKKPVSSINEITNVLRRVRRTFDAIKMRHSSLIDDAVSAVSVAIASESRSLGSLKFDTVYVQKQALLQADSALQSEIKLFLETLTVDRSALDQYLRSIKASCEEIINANDRESLVASAINLQRWQSRLQDTYEKYTKAQRFII
jgi:hypothetical protein